VYGDTEHGSKLRNNHKGKERGKKKIRRNARFKDGDGAEQWSRLWDRLSRKTDFKVAFDEPNMIQACIGSLNEISVPEYSVDIALNRIHQIYADGLNDERVGSEVERVKGSFSPMDFIEELSENTSLSYEATVAIIRGLNNVEEMVKNPPRWLQEAAAKIKTAEMDFMLRGLTYFDTAERLDDIQDFIETYSETVPTRNRGIYEEAICDSGSKPERDFARFADEDNDVVCFLKLPPSYKIPLPGGQTYTPDFGLMLKQRGIKDGTESEFYFVIETKGTDSLDDAGALTGSEVFKIRCAQKHFAALGIRTQIDYEAPVQHYSTFKQRAGGKMHE
jgi:type III restriction enzyme